MARGKGPEQGKWNVAHDSVWKDGRTEGSSLCMYM